MRNLKLSKLIFRVVPNLMSNVRCHVKKACDPEFGFVQFRILSNVGRGIDTAKVIADLHGVSQAAISKTVDNLVNQDFLKRHVNKDDRRCVKLELTPKGIKTIENIKLDASKAFEPTLNLLNKDEKLELVSALECLDSFFLKIQENKV
jgi:DNA-binding MarR family transcriptional regulator